MSKAKSFMNEIAFLWDLLRTDRRPPISARAGWVELWDPEFVDLEAIRRYTSLASPEIEREDSDDDNSVSSIPVIVNQRIFDCNELEEDQKEPRMQVLTRIPSLCKEEVEDDCVEFDDVKCEDDYFQYDDVKFEDDSSEYDDVKFEDNSDSSEYDDVKMEDDSFDEDSNDEDYFLEYKKPKLEEYAFDQNPNVEQYPLETTESRTQAYSFEYTETRIDSTRAEVIVHKLYSMEYKEYQPPPPGDDDYVPY